MKKNRRDNVGNVSTIAPVAPRSIRALVCGGTLILTLTLTLTSMRGLQVPRHHLQPRLALRQHPLQRLLRRCLLRCPLSRLGKLRLRLRGVRLMPRRGCLRRRRRLRRRRGVAPTRGQRGGRLFRFRRGHDLAFAGLFELAREAFDEAFQLCPW